MLINVNKYHGMCGYKAIRKTSTEPNDITLILWNPSASLTKDGQTEANKHSSISHLLIFYVYSTVENKPL